MATPNQIRLIGELLDEIGLDREELVAEFPDLGIDSLDAYEELEIEDASALIEELIDRKREMEPTDLEEEYLFYEDYD